ncbi:hypothetical protein EDF18_2844 [Frigoribacterium sp. PhB107]|uniref:hypothetical protein n=1 Tax=Frigoribacterium sp. PhB107 TaxID=2485172 RepID=UPI000F95717B|nr:hypothetical protein [Frigoribacterium sp. PhB107]ROP73480.1 hypothetical protein EDF18_2844 [Frigoribacterium sp. PhB107]
MASTFLAVGRHEYRLAADADVSALKGRVLDAVVTGASFVDVPTADRGVLAVLVRPGDHVAVGTIDDVELDPDAWSDLVIAVDLEDWAR